MVAECDPDPKETVFWRRLGSKQKEQLVISATNLVKRRVYVNNCLIRNSQVSFEGQLQGTLIFYFECISENIIFLKINFLRNFNAGSYIYFQILIVLNPFSFFYFLIFDAK